MSLSLARQATTQKETVIKRALLLGRYNNSSSRCTGTLFRYNSNNYSTDAAAITTSNKVNREHIIFPNPGLNSFRATTRVLPSTVAEQFAILKACIMSGSMERAERIMIELYKSKPEEMKIFADVNIYNSFLNGFVEAPVPMTRNCLHWFDSMKVFGIKSDANTFAIIVKGFLKMKSYHTARTLITEMINNEGISVEHMLQSEYLTNSHVALFRDMITASQGSSEINIEKLLKDLEVATDKILGPRTEPVIANIAPTSVGPPIEAVPEVRSTNSVGVHFLQEQLFALKDPNATVKMDPFELQLGLEHQGYDMALQRLLHNNEKSLERGDTLNAMNLSPLKRIMWQWHQNMLPMIEDEILRCDASTLRESDRGAYGPFLKLLKPETLSIITILELLRLHNSSGIGDGMKTARAIIDVGKAVEMEYNAVQIKKKCSQGTLSPGIAHPNDTNTLFASGRLFNMAINKVKKDKLAVDNAGLPGVDEWDPIWPSTIRAKVGSVLTSLLLEAAKIPVPSTDPDSGENIIEHIPAFFHTYQYVHGKRVGIIKFSEQLTDMLSREPVRDTLHPRLLPMLVHPQPWLDYNSGGYLSTKSVCMRIKDSAEQLVYLQKASEQDHLKDILAGLDVLGSTCWRVNSNVFKVILEAWNSGEAIADIPPPVEERAILPPKPENYDTDPKAKFNWVTEVKQIQTTERNNHSLRCDVNYKVETARAYLNLPMYFPHNMDFRGRAYPMPATLNHLGNDLCRGLLHFDEAKALGPRGWRWLKIHLANLYGFDKHSFSEREAFTMENIDNVLDSVDNPLTGKKWWLKADSPWQCLSACYEVAAAFRSGEPEAFKSQLPIHQDGTCNGLQHYAALGGDLAGARAVNLAASDRPADVYTGVADMVNKYIDKAAAEGDSLAAILQGKVSRKVVKQTVMTNVYGVTFVGARSQIESRLKEHPDIPREKVYLLSGYLARAVFSSLGEMFTGAHDIQNWLTDSARRIARSVPLETLQEAGLVLGFTPTVSEETDVSPKKRKLVKRVKNFSARNPSANQMSSVIWTTPLGLPIVQPYRRAGKKQIATLLQTIFIEDPDASRPVNTMKQSSAFPPNFIHSLDATHMLMSAVACHKKGMAFASVHDSYWTHACDVDGMNEVIRDQFIELHSQPIMQNLIAEFEERYKDYKVPDSVLIERDELFGVAQFEKELETESLKKEKEKKNALKALFGLGGNDNEGEGDEESDAEEEKEEKPARPKSNLQKYDHIWTPLKFKPLPAKGEFDINEVKRSQYFFH